MSVGLVFAALMAAGQPAPAQTLHGTHAEAGVACAACHTGEDPQASPVPPESCVTCHGTMIEPLEEGAEISFPDPHRSPHLGPGEVPDCTACHGVQEQPQVTCVRCHRGFEFGIESLGMPGNSGGD